MISRKLFAKTILVASLAVMMLTSCDPRRVFEKNQELPDYTWERGKVLKFIADIQDTITSHNVYINLRNGSGYPYSNLFLFVTTHAPKGGMIRDTVELTLADAKGKWLGKGLGDIWDNRILYKRSVKFPFKGTYTFELEQAMRNTKLPSVMDAGIRIEKVK